MVKIVEVYYNLHKHIFSIRDSKTKLVIGYSNNVILTDCIFKVSETGRQRVLREKRKNVHAFVKGILENTGQTMTELADLRQAYYNPYTCDSFIDLQEQSKIETTAYVLLVDKKIYYR